MTDEEPQRMTAAPDGTPLHKTIISTIDPSKIVEVDGGILVKDVLFIDEGEWADSVVKTPLFYDGKVLSEQGTKWSDTRMWANHASRRDRKMTDAVGRVKNLHAANGGVWGDIYMHTRTSQSKDYAELIKMGEVNDVSIEHFWTEKYNPVAKRYDLTSIDITGAAFVLGGACRTCGVNPPKKKASDNEADANSLQTVAEQAVAETVSEVKEKECEEMDEELKKALSDFDTRLKTIESSLSDDKAKSEKEMSEKMDVLVKQMAADKDVLVKQLSDYEGRVKKLESEPQSKALAAPASEAALRVKTEPLLSKN